MKDIDIDINEYIDSIYIEDGSLEDSNMNSISSFIHNYLLNIEYEIRFTDVVCLDRSNRFHLQIWFYNYNGHKFIDGYNIYVHLHEENLTCVITDFMETEFITYIKLSLRNYRIDKLLDI